MKNIIMVLFVLALTAQTSKSQAFTSVQWIVAEPTESFRQNAGTGTGGQATYLYFFHPRFALIGSVGYIKWGSRTDTVSNGQFKFTSIPVQFGLRFLLSRDLVAPYVGFSVGMNYLMTRHAVANSSPVAFADNNELKFGFTPLVGIAIRVAKPVGINIDGSYNIIYTSGAPSKFFGLAAGLSVGF
ncbi:MAG: outer membrane beta-barrel protein [bacterium]